MLIPKGIAESTTRDKRLNRDTCQHCGGKGYLPSAESLRAKREKAKLTLTAVAGDMGITKSRLSSLETGRWDWNVDLVERFYAAIARLSTKG